METVGDDAAVRLLIVAPAPDSVGGQAVQARFLVDSLRAEGWTVSFVASDRGIPKALRWIEGIPLVRTVVRLPFFWLQLWAAVPKVDVVHVFSASYWSFLLSVVPPLLLVRAYGNKILVNYHSGEAQDHLRHSRLARFILRHVDAIAVPSTYLVDVFAKHGLPAVAISNVVDSRKFRFRERLLLPLRLLCSRSLEPYYCVADVIRAFHLVRNHGIDARLEIVGAGSLRADLEQLVDQLALREHVVFAGAVPAAAIAEHYDRATAFINASAVDNMPVSIMEAFAAGLPVISTDAGGIPHLVQPEVNGLLSPVHDFESLARNVLRIVHDPALAASLVRAAKASADACAWPAVGPRWTRLYNSLLRDKIAMEAHSS
jgi:L-malate glycosyltransferase